MKVGSSCEAYKPKNPLPFRRLKEYSNGIWDETRKEFYPFKISNGGLASKKGIRYYVRFAHCNAQNNGDKLASVTTAYITCDGITTYFIRLGVPQTVAASNVNAGASCDTVVGRLSDPNSLIKVASDASNYYMVIVYAEIPDDPAGGPVVVS